MEVVGLPGTTGTVCYYGPDEDYLYKVRENNGIWMRALGRNEDGTWIIIDAGHAITNLACWMRTSNVKFLKGSLVDLPVTWIDLTSSYNYLTGLPLYAPPKVFTTSREGNEVTITWQPIWMTEDDYRGYMIETWVCQGGKLVFQPIGFVTSYYDNEVVLQNKGVYSVKVTDESGCTQPSRARLYSVEKHGYTNYRMVPWPAGKPMTSLNITCREPMNQETNLSKIIRSHHACLLLLAGLSACGVARNAAVTPVIQTVR